ncbi:MAG: hypothetical protein HY962_03170 [Ignavibacteriae bacterium]|nr:hypothetical protein [Ignavibacteriota bacterium]
MNDRIEELIVSYLHRGSTPEQERELFEACKNNSDVAALLRRHVTMSLKLRGLRDATAVPLETRNALLERINSIPVAQLPGHSAPVLPARPRGFGWAHLFGTALAGVAATVILFLLFRPAGSGNQGSETFSAARIDTVVVTRTETITEYRDVIKPVYITKREATPVVSEPTPDPAANHAPAVDVAETIVVPPTHNDETVPTVSEGVAQDETPAAPIETRIADAHPYLQQYNVMLASLEKVRLTPSDRIRN